MLPRLGVASAALLSLLGSASFAGAADSAPLVLFYSADASAPEAKTARERLAASAARRGGALLDLSPAPPSPPRAEVRLSRGIEAYHDFKYDEALEHLEAGLSEATYTGAAGLGPSELSDFFIYRALIANEQGDGARAWDDFVHAAVIDSTRRLDPVRFPPRVIEQHERALSSVRSDPPASVTVEAAEGCEARLDGRALEIGAVAEIPRGKHFLRVVCPGKVPYGASIELNRPQHVISPALRRPERPTFARAVALGRGRGASRIVWAELSGEGSASPTLLLVLAETSSGKELGRAIVPLAGERPTDAGEGLDDLLDRALAMRSAKPPAPEVIVRGEPRRWYESPWLWGGVGAGVTAAVLAPFLLDGGGDGFGVRLGGALP